MSSARNRVGGWGIHRGDPGEGDPGSSEGGRIDLWRDAGLRRLAPRPPPHRTLLYFRPPHPSQFRDVS